MTSRKRLATIMPPVLAAQPPPRGPSLDQRRKELQRTLKTAPGLSDRTIAAWCCVSRELVGKTRKQLEAASEIVEQPERVCAERNRRDPWMQRVAPNPERTT